MKLVGASNWFVRVPFIAEGMVQGLVGAGLAVVAVLALKHFGFDQAFNDPDSFFSRVLRDDRRRHARSRSTCSRSALVIGVIGASIGLRRFLRT